ncbi:MAG: type II toxin-antitoxin system RelE/ParE family toxin [Gemmatales bacterium]
MSRPLIVLPLAELDLISSHDYLNKVRRGLGQQFDKRVREAFNRIEFVPELYAKVWKDVRAVRIKQFRHVIYYVVHPNRIEALAVMHGSRDDSAWQERLS